jgi:cell division protein FtsZ
METLQVVALGCAGGALPDILRVIERRYDPAPDYLKRGFFWVSLGLLVGLGGSAAYFLSPTRVIDALAIGFSAPSLVSGLLGKKAPVRPAVNSQSRKVRRVEPSFGPTRKTGPDIEALPSPHRERIERAIRDMVLEARAAVQEHREATPEPARPAAPAYEEPEPAEPVHLQEVHIQPAPPRPYVEPLPTPRECAPQPGPFIPPAAEPPVRAPRMPQIEDLPLSVQQQIRIQRGEAQLDGATETRRRNLLERLASFGMSRQEEDQHAPVPRPPPRPAATHVEPQRPAPSPVHHESARRPAGPRPMAPTQAHEPEQGPELGGLAASIAAWWGGGDP